MFHASGAHSNCVLLQGGPEAACESHGEKAVTITGWGSVGAVDASITAHAQGGNWSDAAARVAECPAEHPSVQASGAACSVVLAPSRVVKKAKGRPGKTLVQLASNGSLQASGAVLPDEIVSVGYDGAVETVGLALRVEERVGHELALHSDGFKLRASVVALFFACFSCRYVVQPKLCRLASGQI
eukprot:516602-Amphidinium_carterae.1